MRALSKVSTNLFLTILVFYFFFSTFFATKNITLDIITMFAIPVVANLIYIFREIEIKKENWFVWIFFTYTTCSFAAGLSRFISNEFMYNILALIIVIGVFILFICCLFEMKIYISTKKKQAINIICPFLLMILLNIYLICLYAR